MKKLTTFLASLCLFVPAADAAWQLLPGASRAEAFLQTDNGLRVLSPSGDLLKATGEAELELLHSFRQAGDNAVTVRHVFNADTRLAVLTKHRREETTAYRIHSFADGGTWRESLSVSFPRSNGPRLGNLQQLPFGWVAFSQGGTPGLVWFSPDGIEWEEVYRDEEIAFQSGSWRSGDEFLLELATDGAPGWLSTANGRDWSVRMLEPNLILEDGAVRLGLSTMPKLQHDLFLSEDGETWEPLLDVAGGKFGLRLLAADGVYVLRSGLDTIYFSTDGREWEKAVLESQALREMPPPQVVTFGYHSGAFWYRVSATQPPEFSDPLPDPVTLTSADGQTWREADFPDGYSNEGIQPVPNPDYLPPAHPGGNPVRNEPPPDQEVSAGGRVLRLVYSETEKEMHLFLGTEAEGFNEVHFPWQPQKHPFYTGNPEAIGAAGGSFYVRTSNRSLLFLDPDGDYLPQPLPLRVSHGWHDDRIEVNWSPVPGAELYQIFRSEYGVDGPFELLAEVAETRYDDRGDVRIDAVYHYKVRAVASDADSLFTPVEQGRLWSVLQDTRKTGWGGGTIPEIPWIIIDPIFGWPDTGGGRPRDFWSTASSEHYPWIWSREHHWQLCLEQPGNLWMWDPQAGWLWTRHHLYPHLYSLAEHDWLSFLAAGDRVRWFYHHGTADYISLDR